MCLCEIHSPAVTAHHAKTFVIKGGNENIISETDDDVIRQIRYYVPGPGNSVGIETDYGLDGLGSNPGGDEIFRPSRPALRPTQPSVQWVPGLSRG